VRPTKVLLVLPPLLGTSCEKIVSAFCKQHEPAVEKIARPYPLNTWRTFHNGGTTTYDLMEFGLSDGKPDWTQRRIDGIAERTPAWIELFAPLANQCRKAITATLRPYSRWRWR
jgi:hypothetical protein